MAVMAMKHDKDPRVEILEKIGKLDDFSVYNNMCLVAVYERPEQTKGGILLTQTQRAEDKYQGKAALIVKTGPVAFEAANGYLTEGGPAVGDWIAIRPSDGWPIQINGMLCRMLVDEQVKLRIPSPDSVY